MVETRLIDGRTATFRHEPGRGPALVCIHGSASNHRLYDHLFEALEGRERYAINLPGRAGTDGPPLQNVAEMATFLQCFIDAEIARRYLVVGHSLGGAVAIEHALTCTSDDFSGIALLATGARLRVSPSILRLYDAAAKSGDAIPPVPRAVYEPDTDPALIEEAARHRDLTPVETASNDWHAADSFDRMGDLRRIRAPALIISGTEDTLTPPKYAEYLSSQIADNELHIIEGAGHMLVIERVAEIAPCIVDLADRT